jgi:hypothetical protein
MRMTLELPELGPSTRRSGSAGETIDLALRCQAPDVAARLREGDNPHCAPRSRSVPSSLPA